MILRDLLTDWRADRHWNACWTPNQLEKHLREDQQKWRSPEQKPDSRVTFGPWELKQEASGSHLEVVSFQTKMLEGGRQGHSCFLSSLDSFLFNTTSVNQAATHNNGQPQLEVQSVSKEKLGCWISCLLSELIHSIQAEAARQEAAPTGSVLDGVKGHTGGLSAHDTKMQFPLKGNPQNRLLRSPKPAEASREHLAMEQQQSTWWRTACSTGCSVWVSKQPEPVCAGLTFCPDSLARR